MKVNITARHFDLTNELRARVEDEVEKLKRYFDHIISANAVLAVEGYRHMAEISVKVSRSTLTGTGESDQMQVSIEQAVDKLAGQLKKYKGKLKDRQQKQVSREKTTIPDLTKDDDITLDY
ncbi:MAG: ribosome-associated translation inhibitor RaiA [candidate division Zixibacteria bacterium]|nr:ribosome-associated translation inhibitor RaiA [candidate division Zixibacteria bacterium]NIT51579.1 ribosome-associated translation inhibitor RaiA [candidate division Zixibacteria bacterium]NIW39053.1 ribosome-associated translation inhibitor RaiA [candidate division Zixibacteria bacterium]NIX58635.1 ribosome-associated translation inhibitor RaiA [candidate division Zixibacteria bacterium]